MISYFEATACRVSIWLKLRNLPPIYLFISFHQAIGKHCRHLQSVVLSQCGSVSSKGIASLATKCRYLKRIDVAMTKVNDSHVVLIYLSSISHWQVQDSLLLLSFFRSYALSRAKRMCLKSYELVKNYPGDWKSIKCKFLTGLKKEHTPSGWRPTYLLT